MTIGSVFALGFVLGVITPFVVFWLSTKYDARQARRVFRDGVGR